MSENENKKPIYMISVVNNFDFYDKWIKNNRFTSNFTLVPFDNNTRKSYIPVLYNEFLNNYDYSKESWFIFCHCDWELLEDINPILEKLDKKNLYGPVGSFLLFTKNYAKEEKTTSIVTGGCYQEKRDGSDRKFFGSKPDKPMLSDTFDCQCLIVHSSLVDKYHLRFDENLSWHLYVEDFCFSAKLKYSILSYAITINCCHHSDAGFGPIPKGYLDSLKYMNNKYPDHLFSGTVSLIGGRPYEQSNVLDQLRLRVMKKISS